jgi:hypothetical protein
VAVAVAVAVVAAVRVACRPRWKLEFSSVDFLGTYVLYGWLGIVLSSGLFGYVGCICFSDCYRTLEVLSEVGGFHILIHTYRILTYRILTFVMYTYL